MFGLSVFLFLFLFMLFLGSMVLIRDPRAHANRLFFIWTLTASLWTVANFFENELSFSLSFRTSLLYADFFIAIIAAAFLLLFVKAFLDIRISFRTALLFLLPAVVIGLFCLTPFFLSFVFLAPDGALAFREAWGFYLYAVVLVGYFLWAFIKLILGYLRAKGARRGQLRAITMGLIATLAVTLTVDLAFQNILPVEWFRFGIYSFLFFVIGTAYAIVRHEFLRVSFLVVELILLGILATVLSRILLSASLKDAIVNVFAFVFLLVMGFLLVRNVFEEIRHAKELERLTRQLASANRKLRELDALKTEFLSIASHQLRTPLAIAKGYLSMFLDGMVGKISKTQRETIVRLQGNNEGLIALVNQLLDLSRIESNRLKLNITEVDLPALVNEMVVFFLPQAREKGLELRFVRGPDVTVIRADVEKVRQILTNLIDNGIKYTEKGSVAIRVAPQGTFAHLEVADTGYGLTQRDKRHLFEKFVSGSASKHAQVTSGFGLFVVKKLAEAMGGTAEAQSDGVGKGTTFTVTFPLAGRE